MKRLFIVVIFLNTASCFFAQKVDDNKEETNLEMFSNGVRPGFLEIAVGKQFSIFRDFATSPLFYKGRPIYVALSHIDKDEKRESGFRLAYSFGDFESQVEQNKITSKVKNFEANYTELFELRSVSSHKFNLKWGGQLNARAHIRDNESFGNNSDGFDVIANLFGSVKGTLNIRRNKKLAIGLNIGLINSSYRNGFIYTRQAPLLNRENINDGYVFRLFSGYRINSTMDYNHRLKNGNVVQLSYWWDSYSTGGTDNFEMAAHLLKLSLLFNLK